MLAIGYSSVLRPFPAPARLSATAVISSRSPRRLTPRRVEDSILPPRERRFENANPTIKREKQSSLDDEAEFRHSLSQRKDVRRSSVLEATDLGILFYRERIRRLRSGSARETPSGPVSAARPSAAPAAHPDHNSEGKHDVDTLRTSM